MLFVLVYIPKIMCYYCYLQNTNYLIKYQSGECAKQIYYHARNNVKTLPSSSLSSRCLFAVMVEY